jgi:hypothetical protein
MVKQFAFVVLVSLLLFGCALEQYRSDENLQGTRGEYGADIADCRQLATPRPATGEPRGGDIAPAAPRDAADGGSDRLMEDVAQRQMTIARCMAARGYNVVAQ